MQIKLFMSALKTIPEFDVKLVTSTSYINLNNYRYFLCRIKGQSATGSHLFLVPRRS